MNIKFTKREKVYAGIVIVALVYFVGYPIALQSFPCLDPSSLACSVETNSEKIRKDLDRMNN